MNPPELVVIRHAQSEWNVRGLWQGHADPPLSATGAGQADALARTLDGEPIDRIESSDLLRARQTAAPLAAARGLVVHTDPLYRELDLGAWSGLTREQIATRGDDVFESFVSRSPDARAPGGESRRALWDRAQRAVEALCRRCPGERVAIVTHGGFVLACFPEAEAHNASVHRARADEILERLAARRGSTSSEVY